MRVRSELIAALFDKALDLKNPSNFTAVKGSVDSPIGEDQTNKSGADAGKTLNLMSEDVNKVRRKRSSVPITRLIIPFFFRSLIRSPQSMS